jgi:hypothetical protein
MPETLTPPAEGTQQKTPQEVAREAIVARYEATYGQPPADATVVETSTTTQAPDPVAEALSALRAEIAELKAAKAAPPQQVEAPPAASEAEANWLKLLSEGKQAEAEKALSKIVAQNADLTGVQRRAVSEALELFDARAQVTAYQNAVRQDPQNVEALRMEKYITVAVQQRLNEAQAAGFIKSPADYVKVHNQALDQEVSAARNLALALRGEGRQEGQRRTAEVLSAPNLQPTKIDQQRGQPTQDTQEAPESVQDYFAKRASASRTMHRL